MENKFKVGDKVRNKFCPDEIGTISLVLPPLMGMPMYLIEFIDMGKIRQVIASERNCELVHRKPEPVPYKNVIITIKGNQVIAKDTRTGKTGIARCNPSDKFDFAIGAKIAIERLTGSPEVSVPHDEKKVDPPARLNCKFVIPTPCGSLTPGKIYDVIDGRFTDDRGVKYPRYRNQLTSFTDLVSYLDSIPGHIHYSDTATVPIQIVED